MRAVAQGHFDPAYEFFCGAPSLIIHGDQDSGPNHPRIILSGLLRVKWRDYLLEGQVLIRAF
jgi:hypothetical protein